ncbi:glycerophosphodiester phosphodiesterase family protein [Peribacillus simplex]|uniref:glycerophosphodiester phosphodiesterase family protein n=1 Tax=Peribacillus simplex TaxID=1478 RepID=UPI003D2B4320
MILAHRGQWREYPENSLAAINEAIEDGAEVVEIDVQLTADGVPVLMHDTTVNRTTNGKGKVSDLTLAQIKNLRLKEGLGGNTAALTKHKIPTLEEVMLAVKDRAIVNLDKGWEIRDKMYAVLVKTDTVDHGLFKGSPNVEEPAEFMAK